MKTHYFQFLVSYKHTCKRMPDGILLKLDFYLDEASNI